MRWVGIAVVFVSPLYPSLVIRNALINRRSDMNLSSQPASQCHPESNPARTYHTRGRPKLLRLAPKLIPIPLDIIHAVQNDYAVLAQRPPRTGIRYPPRLLLGARIVVDCPRVRRVVRGDYVDFVGGFEGRWAGREEIILSL